MICQYPIAGVIIKDGHGYILVVYHLNKKIGLSLPAYHATDKDVAGFELYKKVKEETGLDLRRTRQIFQNIRAHPCYRGFRKFDVTMHLWIVFDVLQYLGEAENLRADKYKFVKFMSIGEIKTFIERKDFDPVWLTILDDLGIIK